MKYKFLIIILLSFFLISCSSSKKNINFDDKDKFEDVNRSIFTFNLKVDDYVLEPVSKVYKDNLPKSIRKGISNHVEWASLPKTTLNSTLQGKFENATVASLDFLINGLTLGFADLTGNDEKINKEDFGQTLAYFNFPEGNYVMVPFIGSNTARSFTGRVVDWVINPLTFFESSNVENLNQVQIPLNAISFRADKFELINDLKYDSLDAYSRVKSAYYQNRISEINDGKEIDEVTDENNFESFFEDEN